MSQSSIVRLRTFCLSFAVTRFSNVNIDDWFFLNARKTDNTLVEDSLRTK